MTKETTLAHHLDKLKPVEKGMIVWALNMTNHLGYEIHLGMLPFINVHDVLHCLDKLNAQPIETRGSILAQVRAKLKQKYGITNAETWAMKLDNAKVAKWFGAHPERGHKIPLVHKKRVTVGVKWSLPKRDHIPDDDVLVQPHLVLKPLMFTKGWWQVTCEKKYRRHVVFWLNENCQ